MDQGLDVYCGLDVGKSEHHATALTAASRCSSPTSVNGSANGTPTPPPSPGPRQPNRSSGRLNFVRTKKNRAPSTRGAVVLLGPLNRRAGGVHKVHTLGSGLGRTGGGSGRIGDVSGTSQCSQGLESGSSPTSGTHDPSSGGFLL
jgi:hypothetical protein